ncbi:MAG: hypothetical protein D6791_13180 [Chloroflexi bacterium]|nr:MAG: hypothetical protein D6791_13180 [Chloroflexota bacterium]
MCSGVIAGLLALVTLIVAACQPAPLAPMAPTEVTRLPSVTVADQPIVNGTVTIAEVVSDGPGWLVVHAQKDGKPGPVLGHSAVSDGVNTNVVVKIDVSGATETLYAMLHTDAGTVGTYEFPGPDVPVKVEGKIVTPSFKVTGGLPMPGAAAPTLMLGSTDELGEFLVDADGMTLYAFLKDEPGKSNCYGACADNWPPLLVEGEPVAGEGVNADLLGTTTRDDGSVQVTYNDWPLYRFAGDSAPGDTNGQDVKEIWYVVGPDGELIREEEEEAATPTVLLGGNDALGEFLVGANGMTLYIFTNDEPGKSNCYGQCAENWPPLLVEEGEKPVAGEGVPGKLGVIEREDGGYQVTYNDKPLYFWAKDKQPGDATGHGVKDVWFVAIP